MSVEQYKKYSKLIDNERAKFVKKALDFFDGDQEKHLINLFNSYGVGRTNWQSRGIVPRTRNLVRMIVEKSAMLFSTTPPKMEIYTNNGMLALDEQQTIDYITIMNKADLFDTMINLDQITRLTKTACLLVNYDTSTDNIIFDILHRGNCEILMNESSREIEMVVYITEESEGERSFRCISKTFYVDFDVDTNGQVKDIVEMPNPYGIVPVVPFYDTQKPRMGFWVESPKDLVAMNEMYNIHLSDAEFCAKWMKYPTLYSTMMPQSGQRNVETFTDYQDAPDVRTTLFGNGGAAPIGNISGPDRMIIMDSQGVDNAFVDYKSPEVDLQQLDDVFNKWVKDFAYDWSVRVKTAGDGSANSGFQLVVEEIDNLQLRQQRQRMFETGMRKLFDTVRVIWNATHQQVFSEDAVCYVEFSKPHLPTDTKITEEVWSIRISQGRASLVDYFIEEKGYSKADAEQKVLEIQQYNQGINNPVEPVVLPEPTTMVVNEPMAQYIDMLGKEE